MVQVVVGARSSGWESWLRAFTLAGRKINGEDAERKAATDWHGAFGVRPGLPALSSLRRSCVQQ